MVRGFNHFLKRPTVTNRSPVRSIDCQISGWASPSAPDRSHYKELAFSKKLLLVQRLFAVGIHLRPLINPVFSPIFSLLADLVARTFAQLHRCKSYPFRGLGPQVRRSSNGADHVWSPPKIYQY